MRTAPRPATLEPVRFGEFLRERQLISEEQWLSALAAHWSRMMEPATTRRGAKRHVRIGNEIVASGFLPKDVVEDEARAFHDGSGLDVVEVEVSDYEEYESLPMQASDDLSRLARSERTTLPVPQVQFVAPPI